MTNIEKVLFYHKKLWFCKTKINIEKENPVAAWQRAHFPDGAKFTAIADEMEIATQKHDRLEPCRQFLKRLFKKIFDCLGRLF